MIHNLEWQNIEFKNFDKNSEYYIRKQPNYIKKENDFLILNYNEKYIFQQKLLKLLSNDIVFNYENGLDTIFHLFQTKHQIISQLKVDLHRQHCKLNDIKVDNITLIEDYIDYNINSFYDKKIILSSCTQAIMSIPLLVVNKYFNLEQYVLGEVDKETNDKTLYIDVQIYQNEWNIHIQKPLRIFDQYDTLYCVLIDMDIDSEGLIISIRPFL